MIGPFVHTIDPVIGKIGGFYIWWYGLSYTLGFLGLFTWLRRNRKSIFMTMNEVYSLTIFISLGVLLGGRIIEVFFYEWAYYGLHLYHIPAVWLGGMSTHGILLGAIMGIVVFCLVYRWSFFQIADLLAIAAAYIMGVGRIGNFIDGQIVGGVTDVWWGVQFPDIEGYRHPVVLYDGIKNLLLIPFLMLIRRLKPPRGVMTAHFILWYGFLRIFVDFFREYRTDFMGFPPGQEFNVLMTIVGLFLLFYFHRFNKKSSMKKRSLQTIAYSSPKHGAVLWIKRMALGLLLLLPTIIPSDWTQDVPSRYNSRHADIAYSIIYPRLDFSSEAYQPSDQGALQMDSDKE